MESITVLRGELRFCSIDLDEIDGDATPSTNPDVEILNARGRGDLTEELLSDEQSHAPALSGNTVTFWVDAREYTRVTRCVVRASATLDSSEVAFGEVALLIQ